MLIVIEDHVGSKAVVVGVESPVEDKWWLVVIDKLAEEKVLAAIESLLD